MSMDATLSYKNDDGELVGVAVRGIIHAVPEALEDFNYNEKVEFVLKAAERGGFKVDSSLQLEFYINDDDFDPEWDSFAPLDIFGVVAHLADINFFITDSGKIVEYDPRSVVRVDTALL